MDKLRELRRGVSRSSPAKRQTKQSGHKLISVLNGGENVDSTERSKKEKVRGSNHVNRGGSSSNEDSEMIGGSEGEEELRQPRQPLPPPTTGSNKRTKFPKKSFDECNGVDPAAVPRKLRSAMNKRTRESMSPPSPAAKKLHKTSLDRIETPQINGVKKMKPGMKQVGGSVGSLKQPISGPITKDEEEVVETLYALARMVPDNPVRHQIEDKTLETKSSLLPKAKEISLPASEVPEEESKKLPLASNTAEANKTESFTGDPVVSNLTECTTPDQPSVTENQKLGIGSNNPPIHADLHRVPLLSKTGEMPFCIAERLRDPSELCPDTGLVQPKQHDNHLPRRKTENMFWPVTGVEVEQGQQNHINGTKDNVTCLSRTEGGPVLWPGLCTAGLCVDELHHPLERPSSTKAPAWLDTATCSIRPSSAENIVLTEKVSPVVERNQSWKRCVAHVYISHLIQASRTADETNRCSIPSDQLKAKEGMQSGLVASSNPMGRDGLNGVISAISSDASPTKKSLNDQRLGIPLEKRIQQDQKQAATTSGMYAQQNQSCNFLSLSSGDGGLEASCTDNSNNKSGNILVGNGLEQSTQLHVPYLHSLVQHHPLLPFSMPQTRYSSSHYPDQLTAAATGQQVQVQVPQYLGSPFYGAPHLGHAGVVKRQQHSQSAHMWAAQMATHYRSTGILGSHLPKWHNGRLETTTPFIPCAQAIHPTTTPTSLEAGLSANSSTGQQQQHFFAMSPSSSSHRGKKQQQHHHLPSGYNQVDGGFHSEGSSRKQLLCNTEHV
ncbi:uncharacterized protein LOC122660289 isoform X2 [Telopea speciosissima]|uniref:uncharacterized protein LOC122660289 isoform X2 n=1 Tax=Telopea speciosissima TaxID=54955 RepID=UPI001CC38997|nr:uncharacterized protein LOC122660289 isoform X2 [Telopea speciosissima]